MFKSQDSPGFYLVEVVDTILISVVVLILSIVYKLMTGKENIFKESLIFSKITSFKDLKVMLWKALLLTLTVWCVLSFYFISREDVNAEQLVLPGAIFLLAAALKLISEKKMTTLS